MPAACRPWCAELMKAGLLPYPDALTVNGKIDRRQLQPRSREPQRQVIRPVAEPLKDECRLHQPEGQSVRFSAIMKTSVHLAGIPRALSVQPERPGSLRRQGHGLRRAGGLSRPHRRSGARHRRAHHPVHARRRAGRLSRRRRSRQHAAAGLSHQEGHPFAALHRRRPPVGHVGLAVDPQRLAGSRHRRRTGAAQDRATASASI